MVALPGGVEYGNILETNDLVLERREGILESNASKGLVARGMTTVVVGHEICLRPIVCSQVLE